MNFDVREEIYYREMSARALLIPRQIENCDGKRSLNVGFSPLRIILRVILYDRTKNVRVVVIFLHGIRIIKWK